MLRLNYKKLSEDTKEIMKDAIDNGRDYYDDAINAIQSVHPAGNTHILNSANSCILTVTEALPEPILTVDMGGWNGFKKSCDVLSKKYVEIETDKGVVDIENLTNYIENNDVKSIYITSLAAYTAIQPIKEIYDLCNIHDILLILDISGTVGCDKINRHCDVQIASTGSPKIINTQNGGFINDLSGKVELNKHLLKTFKADNITCAAIANEVKKSPEILEKTIKTNVYLKETLIELLKDDPTHNIIHENKIGINTIITTESKKKAKELAYKIKNELDITNNKSIITTGPNYNRIKTASVNIEVKNIDPVDLTEDNMDQLANIVLEQIRK